MMHSEHITTQITATKLLNRGWDTRFLLIPKEPRSISNNNNETDKRNDEALGGDYYAERLRRQVAELCKAE